MRKRAKKLLALLTAVTVTVTGVNVPAAQAAKVSATASKTTLYYNGTKAQKKATVTVKNAKKKVTYSISKADKKIVSLGKISGKKTKKFTVTAKKAGKATVTVKVGGKKVKSIKFTVKKKTTKATPVPTAAPSTAPSTAPSEVPSQAPSEEPTVAPSQEPTVAPSEAPTETPEPEASRVTEIKITSTQALTSKDGKTAYVCYDVLDQYGKSMRESASINWSTAPAKPTDDRTIGQLAFTKDGDKFNYGDLIVITGVHPGTGVVVSQQVKVGLARALDTVSFEGFLGSDDETKILDTLPTSFADGIKTYKMLFKAKDQDGAPINLEEENAFTKSDVTFISDNPLVASVDNENVAVKTVKGEYYISLPLTKGLYADKGGNVNITAIAQNTGNKTPITLTVGTTGVLGSLEIAAPSKSVYDGDQNVELSYVAKDTAGNETRDYKTIVRSTNDIILNVSEGSIKIAEADDGTAKITWSDGYQRTDSKKDSYAYKSSYSYDGIDRTVSISTVVVGGTNSYITMAVKDAPVPQKVVGSDKILAGNTEGQQWVIAKNDNGWGYVDMNIKSNYGVTMAAGEAREFLKYYNTNYFNQNQYKFWKNKLDAPQSGLNFSGTADGKEAWTFTVDQKTGKATTKSSWTESFGIVTISDAEEPKTEFKAAAAKNSVTLVPVSSLSNLEISGANGTLVYDLADSEDYSGSKTVFAKAATGTYKWYADNVYINVANTGAGVTAADKTLYDSATGQFISFATSGITWVAHKCDSGEQEWSTYPSEAYYTVSKVQDLIDLYSETNSAWSYRNNTAGDDYKKFTTGDTYGITTAEDLNAYKLTLRSYAAKAAGYTVVGTYNGTQLTVPKDDFYSVDADSSQIDTNNDIMANQFVKADIVDMKNSHDDYKAYKKFIATLAVKVTDDKDTETVIKKNVSATVEPQEVTSVDFGIWMNPTMLKNAKVNVDGNIAGLYGNEVKDQYGYKIDGKAIEYTISNYKEAEVAGLNFKTGIQIIGNGKTNIPVVEGAEIGDTFDITASVAGTNISVTKSFTLGADANAYIIGTNAGVNTDADDGLVKELKK